MFHTIWWHILKDCIGMYIMNCHVVVCQGVWEGETGLRSAGRTGWAEGLSGASQEEEQRRFPISRDLNCITWVATLTQSTDTSSPPGSPTSLYCVVPQNTPRSVHINTSCCPSPLSITRFCILAFERLTNRKLSWAMITHQHRCLFSFELLKLCLA